VIVWAERGNRPKVFLYRGERQHSAAALHLTCGDLLRFRRPLPARISPQNFYVYLVVARLFLSPKT
jgi:hypothetical protein